MTKLEFLQILKEELEGRVPVSVVRENLDYYSSYIGAETAKGRSESQVLEELGSPRLLARTIIDAALNTQDRPEPFQTGGWEETQSSQTGETYRETQNQGPKIHYVDFSKWYVRLLAGLIVCGIIFLVLAVFFGVLGLFGWILSVIWPVLLVLLIISLFKGPRR